MVGARRPDERGLALVRALHHDELAMRGFFEEFGPQVFRYALSALGDIHAAQEVLQETMIGVWQASSRFTGSSSVSTWVYSICHNKIVDYIRRESRYARRTSETGLGATGSGTTGSGTTGLGATGSGATGLGATGSGTTGLGATGSGTTGSGTTGLGATGSGATGAGATFDGEWRGPWNDVDPGETSMEFWETFRRLPRGQREVLLLFYEAGFTVAEVAQILEIPAGTVRSRLHAGKQRLRALLKGR
jgi:RNA polymerase sigma factor (sigma-70 family)